MHKNNGDHFEVDKIKEKSACVFEILRGKVQSDG